MIPNCLTPVCLLLLGLLANCAEADSGACPRGQHEVMGDPLVVSTECYLPSVSLGCTPLEEGTAFALTGNECRSDERGSIYIHVNVPDYIEIGGLSRCDASVIGKGYLMCRGEQ